MKKKILKNFYRARSLHVDVSSGEMIMIDRNPLKIKSHAQKVSYGKTSVWNNHKYKNEQNIIQTWIY